MSSLPPAVGRDVPDGPDGSGADLPPARRPWSAWAEARGDLRSAAAVLAALALLGFPVGVLWEWLAPRADFRITASGPTPIGNPSGELLVADDVVFTLLLAGVGVLAGALAWALLRRRRGVAVLVATGVGTGATAGIAWQLGELLGQGPTHTQLTQVGTTVTTALHLGSVPALAVGPFFAVLAYLTAAVFARHDDLGRPGRHAPARAAAPWPQPAGQPGPALVDVPPPAGPRG